jgi:hypothetical protein
MHFDLERAPATPAQLFMRQIASRRNDFPGGWLAVRGRPPA